MNEESVGHCASCHRNADFYAILGLARDVVVILVGGILVVFLARGG